MADKDEIIPILFLGIAVVTSIITGVGLFVSDLGGYYVPLVGTYYLGAGPVLIVFGITYLIVLIICVLGILQAVEIISFELPNKIYLLAAIYCLIVFVFFIVAGITYAVLMTIDDYYWWFDFAFYAGVIGSPLTSGFLLLAYKVKTS